MLAEETIEGERIEVLTNGALQVRDAIVLTRDGVHDPSIAPRFHRYVLAPGDDLTGKADRIVAVANAVWTDDVIAAYRAAQAQAGGEA